MQERKPIKRSRELVPLSRDHHDALLLCWKIRYGLDNNIDIQRISGYVLHVFEKELMSHFAQEEQYIFSLLADSDPLKKEVLAQHSILNNLNAAIKSTPREKALLQEFSDKLNNHVRFEERQVFPYIEQKSDPILFAEAGKKIEEIHQSHECLTWKDEYWVKKK